MIRRGSTWPATVLRARGAVVAGGDLAARGLYHGFLARPELRPASCPARQNGTVTHGSRLRQGQADGTIRADADPDAAAWLLLSVLASRPFRAAAMPDRDRCENGVAALALQALMPSAACAVILE